MTIVSNAQSPQTYGIGGAPAYDAAQMKQPVYPQMPGANSPGDPYANANNAGASYGSYPANGMNGASSQWPPQSQESNGWESKQEWPGQQVSMGGGWNQGNDWMQTPTQGQKGGGMMGHLPAPTEMQWNTKARDWNSPRWDENDKDDDEVRIVRGKNGGKTVDKAATFEEVRRYFPAGLVDILTDGKVAAFDKPTAIQAYTWPSLMQGEDIIGVAKTGSGKTLAFLLPGFIRVKQLNHDPRALGPKVLVLAPTRELCQQIYAESEKFGEPAEIYSACAYGGADKIPQLRKFRMGPHVCIACPGRLLDFLQNGQVKLDHSDYFVLDEADRMLDMGFEPQIRSILHYLPNDRQSCLFTATWPKEVVAIAQQICFKDSVHIQVGTSDTLTSNSDITQHIIIVDHENEKWPHIQRILEQVKHTTSGSGGTLIFTATKRGCANLARQIYQYMHLSAAALHGDMEQRQRDVALRRFKEGHDQILVATDVAQRGLDVRNVAAVINFDTPNCAEDYVHRIGRTGRAGDHGDAYTFLFRSETARAKDIYKVMQKSGQEIPPELSQIARVSGLQSKGSNRFGGKGGKSSFGGGKGFGQSSFGKGGFGGGSSFGKGKGFGDGYGKGSSW